MQSAGVRAVQNLEIAQQVKNKIAEIDQECKDDDKKFREKIKAHFRPDLPVPGFGPM